MIEQHLSGMACLKQVDDGDNRRLARQCASVDVSQDRDGGRHVRPEQGDLTGDPFVFRSLLLKSNYSRNRSGEEFCSGKARPRRVLFAVSGIFPSLTSRICVVKLLREEKRAQCQDSSNSLNPAGQSGVSVSERNHAPKIKEPNNKDYQPSPTGPRDQTDQYSHNCYAATPEAA